MADSAEIVREVREVHVDSTVTAAGAQGGQQAQAGKSKGKSKGKGKETAKGKGKGKETAKEAPFMWEDDEVELLLSCVAEYKVEKTLNGVDWESLRSKYQDILKIYVDRVPSPEACAESGRSFPHGKEISKETITTKLKSIRLKYREAIDDGRRSGHGRVVLLFYELCERIWGGSPATEQIHSGLESGEPGPGMEESMLGHTQSGSTSENDSRTPTPPPLKDGRSQSDSLSAEVQVTHSGSSTGTSATYKNRRDLLDAQLNDHRHSKLKRKASPEAQLLAMAQEELQLKKKFVTHMEKMEEESKKTLHSLTNNLTKMTDSITVGFGMLQQLFSSQAQTPPPMMQLHGHQLQQHQLHRQTFYPPDQSCPDSATRMSFHPNTSHSISSADMPVPWRYPFGAEANQMEDTL